MSVSNFFSKRGSGAQFFRVEGIRQLLAQLQIYSDLKKNGERPPQSLLDPILNPSGVKPS